MSDKEFTAIEASGDIVASSELHNCTKVGFENAVRISPYEGLTYDDSYEGVRDFLESEHNQENKCGFEMIHEHNNNRTEFNLLLGRDEDDEDVEDSDDVDDNTTLDNFGDEDLAESRADDIKPLNNLKEGRYLAGGEVHFEKDYWHGLLTGGDFDRDPLKELITEISKNNDSDVTTVFQLTATPIENRRVRKRYPIKNYIRSIGRFLLYPFAYLVLRFISWIVVPIINGIIQLFGGKGNYNFDYAPDVLSAIKRSSNDLTGYSRRDFLAEIRAEKETVSDDSISSSSMEGTDSKDSNAVESDIEKAIDRASNKAGKNKFAVKIRLLVIGDNKSKVERRVQVVNNQFSKLYSTPEDDGSVQQRLTTEQASNKNQMKELLIDISQRKTATNVQNRFRDKEGRFKSLHRKRRKPTIMTADEIATIIHMPSQDVKDRSINYGKDTTSGQIPDYGYES
jgi:hypothetical protein